MENEKDLIPNPQPTDSNPPAPTNAAEDYIKALEQLKSTTVDKALYDAKVQENRTLIEAIMQGKTVENNPPSNPQPSIDIDQLRRELYVDDSADDLTNLQYVEKTLALRKAVMDNGGADPFLPAGHSYAVTEEDKSKAQRVADALQYCVEYAEGDSEVFTNELMRITDEVKIPMTQNKNKNRR